MKNFLWFNAAVLLASCSDKQPPNKFDDPIIQQIADLQDRRMSDSLYIYFDHENETYRYESALAFGSVQDSTAVERLAELLKDTSEKVRAGAAFAIGQTLATKSAQYLIDALQGESSDNVRNELLEGIGKTISKDDVDGFLQQEIESSPGYSWCLYRLGLRGITDTTMVTKASALLDASLDEKTRLGAAHFFARSRFQNLALPDTLLADAAQNDVSPEVRMVAVSALRRVKAEIALPSLAEILVADKDYRVRVNAVRTLQSFPTRDVEVLMLRALEDSSRHVQIASAEAIQSNPNDFDRAKILNAARQYSSWRTSSNLFEAALTISDDSTLVNELFGMIESLKDRYATAAYMNALGQSPSAFAFVSNQLFAANDPVIKSTAASTIVTMNRSSRYDSTNKPTYADLYKRALQINDLAVIGTIASALRDPRLGYKGFYKDNQFLFDARSLLSLPKDNEAIQALESTINYFEDRPAKPVENEFNHPIDWELVKTISKAQKARINTTKGDIVIKLMVEEAPGSVANFVQLARDNYFDGKTFHRVVPNFVIQGGCNRGDGWGGEDYSIRSEFSQTRYAEGSVGMASAGKDTEGTQWFITHSPTPHLDGRYTIFAEVVSGMEVVHQIHVGDLIQSIELVD